MIDIDAIEILFQDYADGFNDFDADAVADCFTYPATIWQLGKGHVFAHRDELIENVEALLGVLESEDVVHSAFEVLSHAVFGPTALATVSWRQERADGDVAMAFICHYSLMQEGDRALIAMIVNET